LCAENQAMKKLWYCQISKNIGKSDPICKMTGLMTGLMTGPVVERIIKQPMIIIPVPSPYCNEKWDYKNQGADWQCECSEGKQQSPIDLPKSNEAMRFYNKTLFDFYTISKKKKIKAVYEDYMIKIKGKFGRLITWDLIQYDAYEMQFHTHSDHSIKGKYYDLEVQVLFRATTPGYVSKLAVLSILFKVKPGKKNLFFDKDINILDLPDQMEKTKIINNDINIKDLFLEDETDLYQPFSYFQYEGSLTTPPCQGKLSLKFRGNYMVRRK
jgi:carbonic anhydrase